jgi:hypothetical protein
MASIFGLSHSVIVKTPGLLPMLYRAREIGEELEISTTIIHGWIKNGLPYSRDSRGHIWINGQELAVWIRKQNAKPKKGKMKPQEAYCMRCRRIVQIENPHIGNIYGKKAILSGNCPSCAGRINRGIQHNG